MNVSKISFSLLALLISLNILAILKVLNSVDILTTFKWEKFQIAILIILLTAKMKSKIFHLSLKYNLNPNAINLNIASIINIPVNI